jgi:hypothetical protein
MPLAAMFGSGTIQLGRAELPARQAGAGDRRDQPAQGSDPGLSFYHVSDRYAPFHSRSLRRSRRRRMSWTACSPWR